MSHASTFGMSQAFVGFLLDSRIVNPVQDNINMSQFVFVSNNNRLKGKLRNVEGRQDNVQLKILIKNRCL